MKICYINPTFILRRPLAEIIDLMVKRGENVTLMWPKPIFKDYDSSWHVTNLVKSGKVRLVSIPCLYLSKLRYPIPEPFTLFYKSFRELSKNDIVHIWAYFYPTVAIPMMVKFFLRRKKKVILTMDGLVGYLYKSPVKFIDAVFRFYARTIGKILFSSANVITFYSKILLPYAKEAKMPIDKIKVIPTGIHLEKFSPGLFSTVREEFMIDDKSFVVSFVGMITERKGVDIIIKVCARLIKEGYDVKVLIAGEGLLRKEYEELSSNLLVKENIIFMGNRHDIPQILNASDVYFMPSRGEGLSGSIMEAMACGLPIVATDDGLTKDLVIHGVNGFLGRIHDDSVYYDYLLKLINDKKLRIKMGKSARAHIETFSWENVFGRYLETYEGVF